MTTAQPAAEQARPERSDLDGPADLRQDSASRAGWPSSPLLPSGAAPEDSTALLPVRRPSSGSSPDLPGVNGTRGTAARDSAAGRGSRSTMPGPSAASVRPDPVRPDSLGPDSPAAGSRRRPDAAAAPYGDQRPAARTTRDSEQAIAALTRLGSDRGGRSESSRRSRPAPLENDPLTSPSFPAVSASDSRSYRGGRPDAPSSGNGLADEYGMTAQPLPDRRAPAYRAASADPLSGYGSTRAGSHSRDADSRYSAGGQVSGSQAPGGPVNGGPGGWTEGYGQSVTGTRESTGPNAYQPPSPAAPAAAGYRDYGEQPLTSGNPYGSYVSAPADSYPASGAPSSRPDTDPGYGSYPAPRQTRQYSQPAARQPAAPTPVENAPAHAVPLYAAPVPVTAPGEPLPGHSSGGHFSAGYGGSWYDTTSAEGYADQTAVYPQPTSGSHAAGSESAGGHSSGSHSPGSHAAGSYSADSYPAGNYSAGSYSAAEGYSAGGYAEASYPGGHPAGSHVAGSHAAGGQGQDAGGYPGGQRQPDYPPAAYPGSAYGPPAYQRDDAPAAERDQHGYGTPDSGYGRDAYGGYSSY